MEILGLAVVGMVIGLVARWIRPGRQGVDLKWTFVLGVLGAVIGGAVASKIGTGSVWDLNVVGTLVGVVAAILLVGAAEGLVGRRGD